MKKLNDLSKVTKQGVGDSVRAPFTPDNCTVHLARANNCKQGMYQYVIKKIASMIKQWGKKGSSTFPSIFNNGTTKNPETVSLF